MSDFNFIDVNSSNIYETIITSLENSVGEPLYPGDERRIFGEALVALFVSLYTIVNDTAKQKMLKYARGEILDALGERYACERIDPEPAVTVMRFAVSSAIASNIIIEKGTRVTPDNAHYFATTETVTLQAGALYVDVNVEATEAGTAYNGYSAGMILQLVDLIPYIDSITNLYVTHGGDDGEPYTTEGDNLYRDRIRLAPTKLSVAGPEDAYRYHALSADSTVVDVSITSPTPGVVKIVPICTGGAIPDADMLTKVYNECNAKDVRPMTDQVVVAAPTQIKYRIEVVYYTTVDEESKCIETIEGNGGAIDHYIAWQRSTLGRNINPDKLRSFMLAPNWESGLTGATRVDIIKPEFTVLDDDEIACLSPEIYYTSGTIDVSGTIDPSSAIDLSSIIDPSSAIDSSSIISTSSIVDISSTITTIRVMTQHIIEEIIVSHVVEEE
ncbi:MAG: baseplate J/gp47 family protein [bacterium]|nr:baseplate J/gp47 family protein [bacterium]